MRRAHPILPLLLAAALAAAGSTVWLPERAIATPAAVSSLAPPLAALLAAIPPRPASAPTGSALAEELRSLSVAAREQKVLEQVFAGNVPSFLRELRPVRSQVKRPDGSSIEAVMYVMPDYLAVGSDSDFVRVPLGLDAALTVARRFGCTLPTRKMVDTIYQHAERKVSPRPMTPGAAMTSIAYVLEHNRTIEGQLRGLRPGSLVSGDKKDVVLTRRLFERPGKVAIYGWHRENGQPIQPLSTIHEAAYADYSHGVRLVSGTVLLDGKPRSIFDLLEDDTLAALVSDEGVDRNARRLLGAGGRRGARGL